MNEGVTYMQSILAVRILRATIVAIVVMAMGAVAPPIAAAGGIDCGDTLTEDTTLESDLVGCPADGLLIGADGITLDLNGHSISGPGTTDIRFDGVDNSAGHDGVTIKNGVIQNFADGVFLDGGASDGRMHGLAITGTLAGIEVLNSSENMIAGNTLSENINFGIIVIESSGNRIVRNTIAGNGVASARVEAAGILLAQGSSDTVIKENRLSGNHDGVQILGSNANRIVDDSIRGNLGFGVIVGESSGNEIVRNAIARNGADGILLRSSDRGRIAGNTLTANDNAGIQLPLSERIKILENSIVNSTFGMLVSGPHNRIARNTVSGSDQIAINLADDANVAVRNTLVDNEFGLFVGFPFGDLRAHGSVVLQNEGRSNAVAIAVKNAVDTRVEHNLTNRNTIGITVSESRRTLVKENSAKRNNEDGIFVLAALTTLTRNIANANGDLGIEAPVGVTDGGGNRARRNGDPRQCVNVTCA
jgi:parallel beta-helix repeat protein